MTINNCFSCGAYLLPGKKCKVCVPQKIGKEVFHCGVTGYGIVCDALDVRRTNPGKDPAFYMCSRHWDRMRPKSAIEKEIDERSKVYANGAKIAGMSNYEFCKEVMEGYGVVFKHGKIDLPIKTP